MTRLARIGPAALLLLAACTPGDVETLARRAVDGGRYPEARRHYERLAEWYPERPDYHLWIARLSSWLGEYGRADRTYAHVLALDPQNVEALVGRAYVAMWQEQWTAADRWLRRARRRAPASSMIRLAAARRHHLAGNDGRAARIIEHLLRDDPGHCEAARLRRAVGPIPEGSSLLDRAGRGLRTTLCALEGR